MGAGIFWMQTCKLCEGDEGIVVASEYGMSKVILDAGFNLATLMARCAISCVRMGFSSLYVVLQQAGDTHYLYLAFLR